ncbi:aminoglycoside 3'-phosphotransferase/choline kinase family protein [Streptomyces angustmyceticus]|uniref:aminoglycoside phosphotransferase family protein n=1 Tax=Streptomyces angustmyceticus TaxID=285578 RepID=UPI000A366637|nr:aminoglycoside 3'-phosphotransferase/choline kinase family protein [Streptomyces angustmyceticus]UAL67715.1 aminoglycoside 3'-phosphotransferase/choline kinase family protein [Streptomyces angustmyceticus]
MLPRVDTDDEWDAIVPDEAVMRPGAAALCDRLGLRAGPLIRFPAGSQPVYAVGDRYVLKLFPASAATDGLVEARVLAHLQGQLPVPTPYLHDAGACENGWRYVLMSRLRGTDLAVAWPRIPPAERDRIATEAGETLAALHARDTAPLADVLGPGDWDAFTGRQRGTAVARQRAHGLPEPWLEQIPGFLDAAPPAAPGPAVLLHTEFMRQHLTVDEHDDWRLTGLLDFEPAMIGSRAYDFVAVGLFVSRGDPRLLTRVLRAYGETFAPATLLAHTLLHRYSNLPWYLRELPAPPRPTLDSLAETWFGTG